MEDAIAPVDASIADLRELVLRAESGDAAVLLALRQHLESQPQIWQQYADFAGALIERWIQQLSFGNPLIAESLALKVDSMKTELGGTHPTALERLLIERVVICWLQRQQVDGFASQLEKLPKQVGALVLQRQKHARRQFLRAIRTLATVKRLEPASLRSPAQTR